MLSGSALNNGSAVLFFQGGVIVQHRPLMALGRLFQLLI